MNVLTDELLDPSSISYPETKSVAVLPKLSSTNVQHKHLSGSSCLANLACTISSNSSFSIFHFLCTSSIHIYFWMWDCCRFKV